MEIKSLEKLRKDGQVYNLYNSVIVNNRQYSIFEFLCTDRHQMRIDLIAFDIYGETNYIDILCTLNNIFNVFTIQTGDVIYYVDIDEVDNIQSNDAVIDAIKDKLKTANTGKEFKRDKNREKDLNNRSNVEKEKKLPSNIIIGQTNFENVNGKLILKPNFS